MDRYDSFQLGAAKSDVCSKCGMHKSDANKCCNDEVKIFKIDNDQQVASLNYKFTSPETAIEFRPVENMVVLLNNNHSFFINDHSPPVCTQDIYLQNCVFRI